LSVQQLFAALAARRRCTRAGVALSSIVGRGEDGRDEAGCAGADHGDIDEVVVVHGGAVAFVGEEAARTREWVGFGTTWIDRPDSGPRL
jgi:hypothetical protein